MNEAVYNMELAKCVRCGACKTLCPTFLTTMNETMGARGRITLLGELQEHRLQPSKNLAEKIFSCMLCEACRGSCPTGINIPEAVYRGRARLRDSFKRGMLLRNALRYSSIRMDSVFRLLRGVQRLVYHPSLFGSAVPYFPEIAARPFKNSLHVHKKSKRLSRVAIFAGCSVNYFFPGLGKALSNILQRKGFDVVVYKGEACCGAPLRSAGLEKEALGLAKKNIGHFSKVRAEAIVSMCPTCTMVIREQYPDLAGGTIPNFMDVNEFFIKYRITEGLEVKPAVMTYHDPCHLNYGLGIREEPRRILKGIRGIELAEMRHSHDCCGFAGLFSLQFREISREIGEKKIGNILRTNAGTVVTSCPGCILQIERLGRRVKKDVRVRHIVEVVDEAMSSAVK